MFLLLPDQPTLPMSTTQHLPPSTHTTPSQRLELVARVQLAHYLELPLAAVPASITEYTTTDIAAACSVAGLQLTKGGKKTVRLLHCGVPGGGLREGGAAFARESRAV